MTELAFRSATALAAAIRAREFGSRELLEHYLKRVERHNPALNAIIVSDLRRARQRADEAGAALARGENWGPLHGLPMTVKESFDVVGLPTTWGLTELKENIPTANALAVDRLLASLVIRRPTGSLRRAGPHTSWSDRSMTRLPLIQTAYIASGGKAPRLGPDLPANGAGDYLIFPPFLLFFYRKLSAAHRLARHITSIFDGAAGKQTADNSKITPGRADSGGDERPESV